MAGTVEASPAAVQAALLGARMLAELFAAHPPGRGDVLGACAAALLGAGEDAALPFLHLLALLVGQRPHAFAAHARCLKARLLTMPIVVVQYPWLQSIVMSRDVSRVVL